MARTPAGALTRADRDRRISTTTYTSASNASDDDLHSYARVLDLDLDLFGKGLAEHVHADRVHEDFLSGVRSGVNGTPTFFINGLRHDDSYESETLLLALQRAAELGEES